MAKKRDTGPGVPYSEADAERVAQAVENAYVDWLRREQEPTTLNVRAQVEWAGHVMPANNGVRRTRLPLPAAGMARVREMVQDAKGRRERAASAKPAASRRAKGWHAQLRELLESPRGSKAADRVGLDPDHDLVTRWLRYSGPEDRAPNKANQEKIHAAYQELRMWNVTEAKAAADRADRRVADALTDALRDEHGPNIRFRQIEDFRFE